MADASPVTTTTAPEEGRSAAQSTALADDGSVIKKDLSDSHKRPMLEPENHERDFGWLYDEETRNRRDKTRGVFLALFMLIVMAGAGSFLIADIAHLLNEQDLVVTGDTVLLRSNVSSIWYTEISFSRNNFNESSPTSSEVQIFKTPCNDLDKYLRTEDLLDEDFDVTYFNTCESRKGKTICFLDDYLYLANSNDTMVQYDITLPANFPYSSVNITVFNSHYNLLSYLNGEGGIPIVKMSPLSKNFTFDLRQLVNSSYYYFTIEAFNGTVEWFNYTRSGQRSVFNVTGQKPRCVLAVNGSSCSVSDFASDGDTCFLAKLAESAFSNAPSSSDMIFVVYNGDIFGTAVFIASLILCAIVFISAFAAGVMCLGIGTVRRSKWSFSYSPKIPYVNFDNIQE